MKAAIAKSITWTCSLAATVAYAIVVKGVKAGDSRNRIILNCDELTKSVEATESTTVY